ncbi:MAG: hypothetical protein HC913_08120 [Microscillaceae bacterium]|nr:hypothetical protein [Microscillaceae bacterium]
MIPMRSGGFYSDGGRILNLWRGGYAAQIDTALLTAYAHLVSGMRPKAISPLLLLEALELPQESPFKGYLHNLLHHHYLDKGEMEMAAHHLEKYETYLQEIPEGYQASFWLDKAFFLAFVARDAEAAQQAFDQARLNPAIAKSVVYRVEAALALVHQNWEQAHYKAEMALKELANSIDKGSALAQKEWVEGIGAQAREAQNQALALGTKELPFE